MRNTIYKISIKFAMRRNLEKPVGMQTERNWEGHTKETKLSCCLAVALACLPFVRPHRFEQA